MLKKDALKQKLKNSKLNLKLKALKLTLNNLRVTAKLEKRMEKAHASLLAMSPFLFFL